MNSIYQFDGNDLFIGDDVFFHPALCMGTYWVEDKRDNFLFVFDDFGNLVKQPMLRGATERHHFRQDVH